ncbi:hypothetical protein E3P89_00061 [Wallemia ichthyophaga]|uniref:TERF2-interacting telomeric protein 1 Myb domain-containing protein n=1 Tax=Wallemia ichthyophaga TaxID=245174 RepID=A0A4T0HT02_WALIC|nr:hypothetical protein E3P90_00107 [Wallemia ichthyophaga]TIB18543.1 hypothetical protein E3P93_00107 [Wallemia ichthyophaga]TIB26370.1 hypothetical protein E3P89_00061 [Wallemia ichthyophaga]TIB27401.1 hypothetical protein E3P88_00107 [Wallemia ichthyophaga]
MVRHPYTKHEKESLALYLARNGKDNRSGNNLYKELVEDPNISWAGNHTWQSWREQYVKHTAYYNSLIAHFERSNNIPSQSQSDSWPSGSIHNDLNVREQRESHGTREPSSSSYRAESINRSKRPRDEEQAMYKRQRLSHVGSATPSRSQQPLNGQQDHSRRLSFARDSQTPLEDDENPVLELLPKHMRKQLTVDQRGLLLSTIVEMDNTDTSVLKEASKRMHDAFDPSELGSFLYYEGAKHAKKMFEKELREKHAKRIKVEQDRVRSLSENESENQGDDEMNQDNAINNHRHSSAPARHGQRTRLESVPVHTFHRSHESEKEEGEIDNDEDMDQFDTIRARRQRSEPYLNPKQRAARDESSGSPTATKEVKHERARSLFGNKRERDYELAHIRLPTTSTKRVYVQKPRSHEKNILESDKEEEDIDEDEVENKEDGIGDDEKEEDEIEDFVGAKSRIEDKNDSLEGGSQNHTSDTNRLRSEIIKEHDIPPALRFENSSRLLMGQTSDSEIEEEPSVSRIKSAIKVKPSQTPRRVYQHEVTNRPNSATQFKSFKQSTRSSSSNIASPSTSSSRKPTSTINVNEISLVDEDTSRAKMHASKRPGHVQKFNETEDNIILTWLRHHPNRKHGIWRKLANRTPWRPSEKSWADRYRSRPEYFSKLIYERPEYDLEDLGVLNFEKWDSDGVLVRDSNGNVVNGRESEEDSQGNDQKQDREVQLDESSLLASDVEFPDSSFDAGIFNEKRKSRPDIAVENDAKTRRSIVEEKKRNQWEAEKLLEKQLSQKLEQNKKPKSVSNESESNVDELAEKESDVDEERAQTPTHSTQKLVQYETALRETEYNISDEGSGLEEDTNEMEEINEKEVNNDNAVENVQIDTVVEDNRAEDDDDDQDREQTGQPQGDESDWEAYLWKLTEQFDVAHEYVSNLMEKHNCNYKKVEKKLRRKHKKRNKQKR